MADMTSFARDDDSVIRFVLGGEVKTLTNVDPSMTILQYLRKIGSRTGTKEACGEGGCGACTVVLADLESAERLRYRTINACLHLMPQVDGHALLTVEDLKGADGQLHPVQQALLDAHASQCGFCTPGIVMTLFALYQSGEPLDREAIVNALAGNLCRCTGYRSIIDAALSLFEAKQATTVEGKQPVNSPLPSDRITTAKSDLRELLHSMKRVKPLSLGWSTNSGRTIRYLVPVNLAEVTNMLRQYEGAVLFAGGTDIGPLVAQEPQNIDTVIFIGQVKELKGIVISDSGITIGSATTLTEAYPVLARLYPAFGDLLLRFGSPTVRNLATIGGNIASRSSVSDLAPAFIALEGQIRLRAGNEQRSVPIETFHTCDHQLVLAPGEFIEAVYLPFPNPETRFSTYKITKRHDCDIAAINVAFSMELKDDTVQQARICYGGMAPCAKRANYCERALVGQPWTLDTIETASHALEKDLEPAGDARASSAYRMTVAKNLLKRYYLESIQPPESLRVTAYQQTYE
jgi:xanthine dehydrogenase small subunit